MFKKLLEKLYKNLYNKKLGCQHVRCIYTKPKTRNPDMLFSYAFTRECLDCGQKVIGSYANSGCANNYQKNLDYIKHEHEF